MKKERTSVEKENILWIVPYFFIPPSSGSKLRVWNLYKNISYKFRIFIVSFYETRKERPPGKEHLSENYFIYGRDFFLQGGIFAKLLYAIFSPIPFYVGCFKIREAAKTIKELVEKHNIKILQAEEIYTAQYLFIDYDIKKILILHNVDSLLFIRSFLHHSNIFRKIFYLLQFFKMRRYEKKVIPKVDKVFCVSEQDKEIFNKIFKNKIKFCILPNGVDIQQIQPLSYQEELNLIYVGTMKYYPNVIGVEWFIKKIFPLVLKEFPKAFFYIVGGDVPERLKRYEKKYPLKFVGYVKDLKEWYEKSKITIVPLKIGSGTRLKILESMAYGRPVVSTSLGCEGLAVKDMESILIADNPYTFAQKINLLHTNRLLYEIIRTNARKIVEERYDWEKISEVLKDTYYELLNTKI